MIRLLFSSILSLSLIFSPAIKAQNSEFTADFDPPLIEHTPESETQKEGDLLTISAMVTDDVQVDAVVLYYRITGESDFKQIGMRKSNGSNVYIATLPEADVIAPGIEYYIESTDSSGNTVFKGYALSPLSISIAEPDKPIHEIQAEKNEVIKTGTEEKKSTSKWIWIGLGVLAIAGLAAGGSSGGSGSSSGGGGGEDVPLNITVAPPE